jgi:N-acetyl-gamma-glutamylphosphate reductase
MNLMLGWEEDAGLKLKAIGFWLKIKA